MFLIQTCGINEFHIRRRTRLADGYKHAFAQAENTDIDRHIVIFLPSVYDADLIKAIIGIRSK